MVDHVARLKEWLSPSRIPSPTSLSFPLSPSPSLKKRSIRKMMLALLYPVITMRRSDGDRCMNMLYSE
jgi:hypothetical protein